MKSDFLSEVVSVIHPISVEVLTLADSAHINAEVSKLPWRGQDIDWASQQHQVIDFSQEGAYSSESVPQENFRRFLALQGEKVVMMFSAYEPPVAISVDDFISSWSVIFTGLIFLPKVIFVSAAELNAANPRIVEINPMQFMKGHV